MLIAPDEHIAVLQPLGGQWDLTCSPEPNSPVVVTALTWETGDGVELSRSTSDTLHYSAPADISQDLICYGWSGDQDKTPLHFYTLIVKGTC